jgi:hypothetical protein
MISRIVLALALSCSASAASAQVWVQKVCDPGWTMIHTWSQNGKESPAWAHDICVDHMKDPQPVEIECSLNGIKWRSINGSCEAGLEHGPVFYPKSDSPQ